ncbi:SUMF1/EgtB/PvdO family nonheme iron enzyme [Vibrio algarum]|uniref:SUMF1/EgtB/PvdO family nonheme iron enzyme n=1 Tax=Vibrio algarum TaxID=3020714 RepID=A0ABT4YVQ4_9VIBR|nr:SUMF1/EgtB/PvdO family nonheme iron enzyme [Vibrio sp. KJ40-1]MDB1125659.1 SUMF1/EgtB/PvdO family nonheme iron enzyme [Vibrio sp. KJ40-1]
MRQALPALLLALSPCFIPFTVLATDAIPTVTVQQADETLQSKKTEMDASAKQVAKQKTAIKLAQDKQSQLEKQSIQLDNKLKQTKKALDRDYGRITNEPDFDLRPSQGAYQSAWADVKANQKARLESEQELQELYADLSLFEVDQKRLNADLDRLSELKVRARVERLRSELNQQDELKVSFTNVCQDDMTIAQCADQTKNLALQKAVSRFQSQLIANTSEHKTIKQHLENVSLNIHVVGQKVSKDGFSDETRYQTILDVTMESRPAKNTPCKLLDVESSYCFDESEVQTNGQIKEVQWVTLTIRSNQYQDKVAIDGVRYGSTPLDIMLPVGSHMVTIEKEGYRSFHQELSITGDHTLRAVLREKENVPHSGRKFADALKNRSKAPEMVVIGSGQYLVGENSAKQVTVDKAYAMSATPITVAEFETFINDTNYQTDAELKKICTTVEESQIVPITDSYWRNPGIKQGANSPVVCISQTDAIAYTKWLSTQTGFKYRLPSETEWEVAAQAGSQSAYWWGDSFGAGQANTGWGGTKWSNISTSPVKTFAPNGFGLYDVVGNVWEWTNDSKGVTKGGSWSFSPNQATGYSQLFIAPNTAANYVGFRILRQL